MYPSRSTHPSRSTELYVGVSRDQADRRKFPRSSQRYKVRILSQKLNEEPAVLDGTLINVSLGGALFRVDAYMSPQDPCSVEIYGAAGRVIPKKALAHVVHTSVGPNGEYLLRVEFVKPLKTIKEPGKM